MLPFHPLFRNPHWQTIAGHYWRRPADHARFPTEARLYRTETDVQVLVESQQPAEEAVGQIVMVHGLEGSGRAVYINSLSGEALRAGYAIHRFHMRTCGGTEHLCNTLYHAGLTSDLRVVLEDLRRRGPLHLVGFSLGGNVVAKLAGELGESARGWLRGVCGVSAALDLAACARRVAQPDNRVYDMRFVKRMRQRLQATGRYQPGELAGLNSVMAIDDRITAPAFGFGTAENYYRTQSALRFLDGLRVPLLLIQAKDDTLVPFEIFRNAAITGNPWVRVLATEHGGHLGFVGRRPHRFWLDGAIMDWVAGNGANNGRGASSRV